ncbi:hypothetical protein BCU91_14625 [Shewanella sp. 10N.286.52.B9]|nr:hypothetical protein BCU91_14625 [Shewanella sp. 10N.286.52.B9]
MQDDHLFSGTILDNISFFSADADADADLELAKHCATLACIDEDISCMALGYDSLIGDMGSTLSGGQQLRILIARALYKKTKVLFLDEATSHLDNDLEKKINQNIKQLDITRIMIAHRSETIAAADRVINIP